MLFLRRLYSVVIKPFEADLVFFAVVFFLITGVGIFFFTTRKAFIYLIYIISQGFVISYLLTFFCGIFPGIVKKILKLLILSICFILSVLDLFCVSKYGVRFGEEFAGIVMQTNISESIEFVGKYLDSNTILSLIILLVLLALITFLVPVSRKFKYANVSLFSILLLSALAAFHNSSVFSDGFLGKISSFQSSYIPKLGNNLAVSDIEIQSEDRPDKIVIIIGESFVRSLHLFMDTIKTRTLC